ncbi:hypothetical protein TYRP_012683 [Tyrophagus putrescentiae]|nr:hypothetical protein TYRP_012683 [Tyrophagus putrescentiae]
MSRKSGGKPHLPHLSQALAAPTVVPGIQPQPSNSLPQNSAPSLELSSSVEDEITSLTNGSQQPPSEVVIIRTSGKQYQSVLASAPQPSTPAPQTPVNNNGFQQQSKSSTPAESSLMPPPPNPPPLQNKVVSSNPTLNLLLSQPIVTMAQTAAARQVMQHYNAYLHQSFRRKDCRCKEYRLKDHQCKITGARIANSTITDSDVTLTKVTGTRGSISKISFGNLNNSTTATVPDAITNTCSTSTTSTTSTTDAKCGNEATSQF